MLRKSARITSTRNNTLRYVDEGMELYQAIDWRDRQYTSDNTRPW